jgi:subtilisin family serine protease
MTRRCLWIKGPRASTMLASMTSRHLVLGLFTAIGAGCAPVGGLGDLAPSETAKLAPDLAPGAAAQDVIVRLRRVDPDALNFGGVAYDGVDLGVSRVGFDDSLQRQLVEASVEPTLESIYGGARGRVRTYTLFPLLAVRGADEAELAALAADPFVEAIEPDRPHARSLGASLALIGQPAVAAAGNRGAGVGIAVLDTGVDFTHAAFGSCASAGAGGACRVSFAQDFAPDDASNDDNGHGTNVAAIALGVAPDANILGLDVFRSDGLGYTSDILAAINWVVTNRAAYGIQVMNLSLGGGAFTAACPSDAFASAIQTARSAGVLAAVASGNDGYTNRIASPACVPSAISVGAVYDQSYGGLSWSGCSDPTTAADRVTCFSNSASFVTLLAPGALIDAGGRTMGGTSQAAPHVAGALAVLRAAFPSETLDQTQARLTSTGVAVTDPKSNITTPRIRLGQAVAAATPDPARGPAPAPAPAPAPPPGPDRTAPSGTITIAGGAAWSTSRTVNVALSATDNVAVTQMCISSANSCSRFIAYAASARVSLGGTSGTQTLRVWFRDAAGNTSRVATDTIGLDSAAPTNGRLTATAGVGEARLSWTNFRDTGSGIASYVLVGGTTTAPPCTATPLYSGTGTSFTHTGLPGGTVRNYRVCAIDNVGNRSSGATVRVTPTR